MWELNDRSMQEVPACGRKSAAGFAASLPRRRRIPGKRADLERENARLGNGGNQPWATGRGLPADDRRTECRHFICKAMPDPGRCARHILGRCGCRARDSINLHKSIGGKAPWFYRNDRQVSGRMSNSNKERPDEHGAHVSPGLAVPVKVEIIQRLKSPCNESR